MYDDRDVVRPSRARFLPYLFGGITGVSVALVVVMLVMMQRGTDGEAHPTAQAQPAAYQAAGTRPSSASRYSYETPR